MNPIDKMAEFLKVLCLLGAIACLLYVVILLIVPNFKPGIQLDPDRWVCVETFEGECVVYRQYKMMIMGEED